MKWLVVALYLLASPILGICQPKPVRQAATPKAPAAAPSRPPLAVRKPSAVDQRATVFSVKGTTKNTGFALPQVRLTNLAAVRRINQTLVEYFNGANSDTLPRTARQAVRAAQAEFKENNGQGFMGYDFQVLYNARGVLSLALETTELGAHELITGAHATFDLRTGGQILLMDLVADTTALQRSWRRQVNESTAESVTRATEEFGKDTANLAYLKERVNWDDRTHAVARAAGGWEPDFALTPDGLSLFCKYDLPLPWNELQPQGEYPFAWKELRPWWHRKGPWRNLLPHVSNEKHPR